MAVTFLNETDGTAIIGHALLMEACSPIVARHTGSATDCEYEVAWANTNAVRMEYTSTADCAGNAVCNQHRTPASRLLRVPASTRTLIHDLRPTACVEQACRPARSSANFVFRTGAELMRTRWALVAGTGRRFGLAETTTWPTEAIGSALAREGHGLVVGGWHGVDYMAAEAFAVALAAARPNVALSDLLIQVVPRGTEPVFQGGRVVSVDTGPAEWVEALRFADVAILIGGIGGTYRTYAHAMQERRAVFPVASAGGDAAAVFAEMGQRWHAAGVWGVSRTSFERVLGHGIQTKADARGLAEGLMMLLADHFAFQDAEFERTKLFVSYARADRDLLLTVKTQLRSMPERSVEVWEDSEIAPGTDFERQIQRAMSASRACLLLVTPDFLSSAFIREHELPFLVRASEHDLMRLFWVHARRAPFEGTALAAKEAAHDPKRPIAEMPPSEQRECLAQICLEVARCLREGAPQEGANGPVKS
ncbi:toll/interleukin-1 receptor domain-containing protein [Falsiroseomonas sp. HC035]|uniref:toll/interleukin-1 receptor domain-containing protein n=1 Tax=Falsiroseomonas sp. HC035 TaxID=3390999 RepID=UPI003D3110A6